MIYPGLEGKNVLLIAGHSNLGQHVTRLFAQSGANVIIAARDTHRAEAVAAMARSLGHGKATVVEVDATNGESLQKAIGRARDFGAIDVLYHGVGWSIPGPFLGLEPAQWDQLYELNLRSVMLAYQTVLPVMFQQKSGCIVTLSSVTGRRPIAGGAVYGALKAAVIHLAQALALEAAPHGVRINVVAPGPTPPPDLSSVSANSNFRGLDSEEFRSKLERAAASIPLQRLGRPENVAHAVLYLASPETGEYQTGQVLGVDGGWWMGR